MLGKKTTLEQKLKHLSRTQTPDSWARLRSGIQNAGDRVPQNAPERRQKRLWPAAVAAVLVFALAAGVILSQLLPKPASLELEAGKELKLDSGTIFVNPISRTEPRIGMPPYADIRDLTISDLPGIFGRQPIPMLPEGFVLDGETFPAIIFRSGPVFMMNGITFSTDADDPNAARVVFDLNDQGELPLADCVFGDGKTSLINGVEMLVGIDTVEGENGSIEVFTALFVHKDVGYRIRTTGITGENFIAIIESVVQN